MFWLCLCGSLNENEPYKLIHSSTWPLVGGTIREELGGVALWKEVCQRGRLSGSISFLSSLLYSLPPASER